MLQPKSWRRTEAGEKQAGAGPWWDQWAASPSPPPPRRSPLLSSIKHSGWDLFVFCAMGARPGWWGAWRVGGVVEGVPENEQCRWASTNEAHPRGNREPRDACCRQALQGKESLGTTLSSAFSLPILWCLIPKWAIVWGEIKGSGWKKGQAFSLMISPFCSWQRVKSPFWIFLPGAPEFQSASLCL